MKTFSHGFVDDKYTFLTEAPIYFSQCSKNKRLSLTELLKMSSDIAVEDFAQRGLSRDVLVQHNIAILVSRNSFKIHRMPSENEIIRILTREEVPESFQLVRSYEFTTMDGEPLVSGLSTWIIVDIASRKIIPTQKFLMREPPTESVSHNCQMPARIAVPENAVVLSKRTVSYSDLDSNGHVNNSKYGNYILDVLPERFLEREFSEFKINYSKEALLGDEMTIVGAFSDDDKQMIVAGRTDRGTSFEAVVCCK